MKTPEEIIKYMAYDMPIMKYYDNPEPKTDALRKKRQDMIDNKDNLYIASEKHDGDFGLFAHFSKGNNLIRSRSISKITGVYGDYTAKLPHLCREMDNWPDNTVVLAEICWDEYGTNANTVGTILRCLPAKAVERQKDKKLSGLVFDVLMFNGKDYTNYPYEDRIDIAQKIFNDRIPLTCGLKLPLYTYFKPTQVFTTDFAAAADDIISRGGEGVVIQKKSNPYMPGTRTAWATLKLKQALPHMDLKVVGTLEPNKKYDGDCIDTWKYWEVFTGENYCDPDTGDLSAIYDLVEVSPDCDRAAIPGIPVTKPYYMHWKNGITVMLPSGITTDVASGLTDDDRAYLATPEAQAKIAAGELWAEVKAMSVNDLGKLRHPALVRLRTDLNSHGE